MPYLVDSVTPELLSLELAKKLAEEHEVAVGPGIYFKREGHFRLCFARSSEEVEEGLAALGRGLNSVLA